MAKIFWCCNVPFPAQVKQYNLGESRAGFWLLSLADALRRVPEVELAVACTSAGFDRYRRIEEDGVVYECIPADKGHLNLLSETIQTHDPDIVHIHGTEQDYGLVAGVDPAKVLISIQGLLGPYSKAYWGLVHYWERFRFPSLIKAHRDMIQRSQVEKRILKRSRHFGGRTIWDKAHVFEANPEAQYHYLPELMRPCFFTKQWEFEKSDAFRIYTTSTPRPYKGTDVLIEAVAILKKKFPRISLRIGGPFSDRPLSWSRALRRKVSKLGLDGNVEFIGFLKEEEILAELLKARVYVLPSFIENSPNSLAEAQIVGLPCVATAMGGVLSMLEHEQTGLLTNPGDPAVMAGMINRIFTDRELAGRLGDSARAVARSRHDPKQAVEYYLTAYSKISGDEIS